jgi:hypothetical protein
MYRVEINGREFGVKHHAYHSALEFASHQAGFAGDMDLAKQIRSRMDVIPVTRRVTFRNRVTIKVERIHSDQV